MTRKSYNAIAELIGNTLDQIDERFDRPARMAIVKFTIDLAQILKDDNPRFSEHYFYGACGLESNEIPEA